MKLVFDMSPGEMASESRKPGVVVMWLPRCDICRRTTTAVMTKAEHTAWLEWMQRGAPLAGLSIASNASEELTLRTGKHAACVLARVSTDSV